jgi:N-acetylmuramic acid 6-phosphate etherase
MKSTVDYSRLATEQPNHKSRGLDRLSAAQIAALMNREDRGVVAAVGRQIGSIGRGAEMIAQSFKNGGKLHLFGAGTSGRLAVLEAAEVPPTFNSDRVQAIMAGGPKAVFRSQEGAEDQEVPAAQAVKRTVRRGDVVVGIAASGVTAFVRTALAQAKRLGARTILVTCNPKAQTKPAPDIRIALAVGPEVLTGSTRLKSGTACKMALNMLTTASMVRWGKTYDHWMVDLQPKSRKLVERGVRLVRELGGVSEQEARKLLKETAGRVKPAIVMAKGKINHKEAVKRLAFADGFLRKAINQWR